MCTDGTCRIGSSSSGGFGLRLGAGPSIGRSSSVKSNHLTTQSKITGDSAFLKPDFSNVTHARGVLFVVTGEKYTTAAVAAAYSVAETNPWVGIAICSDQDISDGPFHYVVKMEPGASRRKHEYVGKSPFQETLYLDSDIRVTTDLGDMFRLLEKFDMAGAHVRFRESPDRLRSFRADIPKAFPQINCGVLLYKKCPSVEALFADWCRIYDEGGFKRDQIPFREALWNSAVRFYVLAPEYNKRYVPLTRFGGEPPPKILHLKGYNSRSLVVKVLLSIALWPTWRRISSARRRQAK